MPASRTLIYAVVGIVVVMAVAVAVIYLMSRTGGAPQPTPGVQNKTYLGTIYLGWAQCLTGPFAGPAKAGVDASQVFWEMRNWTIYTNRGYYRVQLVIQDNAYQADKTVNILNQWFQQYGNLMGSIAVCGSHVVAAVYPLAAQHKVLITANADPEVFANATRYSWYRPAVSGTYADQYRAFLKWFRDNWHEGRAPRLAIIWETKAFGPLTYPYVNSFAQQLGYDVHSETLDIGSTDATTQLTRIRDFNPDVIAIIEPPAETGLVMKQSLELGVRPRAMILFVYSLFYGPLIQAYAPIINALEANGTNIYGVSAINYNLTNMPSSISNEIMAAYQRLNKTTDILTIIGTWAAWLVGIKTIQIQDTLPGGVYNLDNTKLALESIRGYTTEGLTAPLTYTAKDHRGPDAFWIYLVVPNRSPVPLLQVGYVDLSGVRPRFG